MKTVLGLVEACNRIQTKQLEPAEYLAQCLAKARALEPSLNAFTAIASQAELENQSGPGPLMGIPVAVKDIFATTDFVTANGSPIYAGATPATDAVIVRTIRSLGGVIFGKTVTTEFAWRHPGPTTNPWNAEYTPGGSSSGSAAAVAAGIVPLALGTQTVGSIVRPAAYCGVVGYKPSFGSVSYTGVHPVARSLDHVGFLTRSVEDAAYAFNLLKNTEATEPDEIALADITLDQVFSASPMPPDYRQPRVGLLKTPHDHLLSVEQAQTIAMAGELLSKSGAIVEEMTLPPIYWEGIDALHVIMAYEAAIVHQQHALLHADRISVHIQELVDRGSAYSIDQYSKACDLQKKLKHAIGAVFQHYDALLLAPATGEAPKGLAFTGDPIFCALWSLLGLPAIQLPFRKSTNDLPLGIQLVANNRQDGLLLNLAQFAEKSFLMANCQK